MDMTTEQPPDYATPTQHSVYVTPSVSATPTQHPNYAISQSVVLHELFLRAAKTNPPKVLPAILWITLCLECIAAILYVASAVPTIRKEGFWLFKTEANGMVRPNIRVIIPMCVVLYVMCDTSTLFFLLMDLKSNAPISTATCGLGLITYPLLVFTGWTKIWNVLRAVPLNRYGLTTARQGNGEFNATYFRPSTINLMSALFYGFPLIYGAAPICLVIKELWQINFTFKEYNRNYSAIISGNIDNESIAKLNIEALNQMASMFHGGEKVLFLARIIAAGFLLYLVLSFSIMLFGYIRILQAVRFQIATFRQSYEQRMPFAIGNEALETASAPSIRSISISYLTSSCDSSEHKKRSWISTRLPSWLPNLRQTPDFLEKSRRTPVSNDPRTLGLQEWENDNRSLLRLQLKALRRYEVNLIWQLCCNALTMFGFCGMNIVVCFNLLDVPTYYSISDLSWFTITWASISWVWTIGIPMGIVVFVVSRSPPISALRENTERLAEEDV
ncbi:hypothetical protein, variant 2 [Puccinia triticina 1-1 BBBD Race 1]|uniref:Uncharacterized protein n=1 Tax=Puccinia triticina (isolate 1-1 / race 1 (BBBD)) TaxID=630390 RepID=A0A180GCE2_PUCT1|nr:hypothetical protein PTTG_12491 [Puccinia triticina 1-1 BBBD Race 1]OAV90355.1 hypothetical protein, variant 1 [Puccinia triticina 1-1 BBBD Race 1]OAV90356.1 hypothetical protein, variant 2 [Puccinia triticina 1-1 BBBD Race 1]WAR56492.1 hypothetical protein PtB15_7B341 [Puccinia triticina]